ncbi:hypothetical protein TNCT_178101 [Trichonephila clavata]|uniref:Uncharacterized protein n=1 Tax=Trichonephila clavata TaxID=2740835 RepID=A0A8X6G3Z3_TRICU|nr:hypothetical protein TNCT_178101 [Trichonephila clavata]
MVWFETISAQWGITHRAHYFSTRFLLLLWTFMPHCRVFVVTGRWSQTLSKLPDVLDGRPVPLRRRYCALSFPDAIKASARGTMKSRSGVFDV